jgi:heme/copper-type cytochrome/quinol oxidase subunit 4
MNKIRTVILSLIFLILTMPLASAAAGYFDNGDAMSSMQRVTYISFVAISLIFIAMAFFLFMERNDVVRRYRFLIGLFVMIVGIVGF